MRIGVLGAARIAPAAIVKPAGSVEGVEVAAVAARDLTRAEAFAAKHGIPKAYGSYEQLLHEVDAVYIALPNALHAEWTLKAIEAGRHVLCEKPFTANAAEAAQVTDAAEASGVTVMEAFHYRYHPLAEKMLEVVGDLGNVESVETSLCFPLPRFGDIRYDLSLAGGATMDAGCYAIHCLRLLGPGLPKVVAAEAKLRSAGVDRAMRAEFAFPTGATGRITTSMWSWNVLGVNVKVVGSRGELKVVNYAMPHLFHRLSARVDRERWAERVPGEATYVHQLRAFAAAAGGDTKANLTPPADAIVTMSLIDDVYRAAGLRPR
ncbi:Gfo/Idh/MocA family oxidoreductase [Actinocorallia longicatena]|uniref:Gfo/Idh/MocA family oxidoreductase n=1 Tax=Actinocorallia longicatena TaxID=111803 RepID=A0ABP6QCC9_9ACTN